MPNYEKRIILSEFDGTTASIRALSRKLVVSQSFIRDTLKKAKINAPDEGQQQLDFKLENKEKEQ